MRIKVLIVCARLPHPPNSGALIRIAQFARHLARKHEVTLLTYGSTQDRKAADELRSADVHVVLVPRPTRPPKRAAQLLSLASIRSHLGGAFHSHGMQLAIDGQLASRSADVVLVESSILMRHLFPSLVPVVLDEHNLEFEALERTARVETTPLRRLFNSVEGAKFKREEVEAWRRADLSVFTSKREVLEAEALLPAIEAIAVPNGVDVDYFSPQVDAIDADSIVFTGTMDYRPNEDAVQFLVREIMPLILRIRPKTVLTLVGGGVPAAIQQLAGPSVVVTGRVTDVRPYIARAAAVVAPLRIGSGTRLKVLEALAMGKAVVSTSIGCEGIDVEDGEQLLIADMAEEIAHEIVRVLEDRQLAGELGARGRALVERTYGWKALCAQMEGALVALAEGRGAGSRDPDKGPHRIASAQAALPRG